jgi:hypothetical protein
LNTSHVDLQLASNVLLGERNVPQNFIGLRQEYRHEAADLAKLRLLGGDSVSTAQSV